MHLWTRLIDFPGSGSDTCERNGRRSWEEGGSEVCLQNIVRNAEIERIVSDEPSFQMARGLSRYSQTTCFCTMPTFRQTGKGAKAHVLRPSGQVRVLYTES